MFLKHMFKNQKHKDVVLTKHLQESCLSNKQNTEYVVQTHDPFKGKKKNTFHINIFLPQHVSCV